HRVGSEVAVEIGDAVRTPSVHLPVPSLPSNGADFLVSRALLCRGSPGSAGPLRPVSELRHGTVNNRNYSPGELPIVRLVNCRAKPLAQALEEWPRVSRGDLVHARGGLRPSRGQVFQRWPQALQRCSQAFERRYRNAAVASREILLRGRKVPSSYPVVMP